MCRNRPRKFAREEGVVDTDRAEFLAREADDAEAVAEAEEHGERPPMPGQRAPRPSVDPTNATTDPRDLTGRSRLPRPPVPDCQ